MASVASAYANVAWVSFPTMTSFWMLKGPLAYSPDGRSIACTSDNAIVIWDIQTGGVAKEIACGGAKTISLVWSADGKTICTLQYLNQDLSHTETRLCTHCVASGTPLFAESVHSSHKPRLCAYEKSFRVMTTQWHPPKNETLVPKLTNYKSGASRFDPISPLSSNLVSSSKPHLRAPTSTVCLDPRLPSLQVPCMSLF